MKRCPQCNRVETDEVLKFCRVDGTALIPFDNDSPTALFDPPTKSAGTTQRTTGRAGRSDKRKPIDSIAVLPFENAGDDPNADYLSDGITESIINNLSQVARLKVMARSTVFSFKGGAIDARRAGNELGVRAVVTGRVQQIGDRLQIGVELVNVTDGSQLWGERYSRTMADIFALQEEISKEISSNLKLKLTGSQKKRLRKQPTKDSQAYQLYLQGCFFWNKRTEESANRAIDYFQRALSLDPKFALGYTGLADAQILLGDVRVQAISPKQAFLRGQQSVMRALELDDNSAEAHGTLGHVSMHLFDWPRAERELSHALELNPNYAQGWLWRAYYLAFTGKLDDSIAAIDCALQLDPLSLPVNSSAGELLYFAGQFDESIAQFRKTIEMDEHFGNAHLELARLYEQRELYEAAIQEFAKARELTHDSPESLSSLAHCYAVFGETNVAEALLKELMQKSERHYVSAYDLALIYEALGRKEKTFEWLDRAYEVHDSWMIYLRVDPRFAPLHSDPRFADLIKRVGLPSVA